MRTAPFKVTKFCHGQACITASDLSEEQAQTIRGIVCNCYMPSMDYQMKKGADPFLQGFHMEGEKSWVLVEFWSCDAVAIQHFVDYVNKQLGLTGE